MTHTPDLDKIKKTLLKVKELADRGEDGERIAAQSKLTALLKKYGIDISEIESQEIKERHFKHHRDADARMVMCQVIVSVRSSKVFLSKNKCLAHSHVTYDEYIEILEKYKYFWKLYKEQRLVFNRAFITRNHLYSETNKSCTAKTESERAEDKEVAQMMMSLKKGEYGSKTETKYIGNE